MKIAYFTPVSPQKTGIADYSEHELLPHISKYADIDIFIDKDVKPNNQYLIDNFDIYCYTEYEQRKDQYDIPLYHMGNNQYHEFIYDSLIKYPGITIIHDVYIHGFLYNISLAKGDRERYIQEFSYCYGDHGTKIAQNAIRTGVYPGFDYPLLKRIVDCSMGVICHSNFGINKVLNENQDSIVCKINHPLTIPDSIKSMKSIGINGTKKKLQLEDKYPVITSFGFISHHKRYHVLIKAFKRFLFDYPNAILLLVGKDLMGLDKSIEDLGLKESVVRTGYVNFKEIIDYLSISDFCVNLRYPTAGETSGSVLRIMAAKKPVIVSNIGWFSELPNNCCLKVDVDSYEEDVLLEYMKTLTSSEKLRKIIGDNAQNYVLTTHNPDSIAEDYYKFMTNIINGNEFVYNQISKLLLSFDVKEEAIIESVSKRIQGLL